MKKIFYPLMTLCFAASSFAQDFALVYEPESAEDFVIIRDVHKTADGNLVAGYDLMSEDVPAAGIMKTNIDGEVLWSKTLEIPVSLAGCTFEVAESAEGTFYLWGLSKEDSTLNMRAILSEISSDGTMLWSKEYDFGTNATTAYTINKLSVLPSGDLQMMIAVYGEVIVMKTNSEGEIIWGKSSAMGPPDEGGKNPGFEWLAIPDDGGMCASKAENDFSLLRYNADGDMLWSKAYQIGTYTHGKTIARAPNGNILVAGFISSVPHIMEISDEDGSITWIKTFVGVTLPFLGKAHLTVIDEVIILDMTLSGNEQYILKMDAEGNVLETFKSKQTVYDYNKIEVVGQNESYFYGGVATSEGFRGIIHRVDNVLSESCMIESAEALVTTEYTDFSEVDFTPFVADFTNEEDIAITLVDQPMRAKFACDTYLNTGTEASSIINIFPNPVVNNFTLNVTDDLVNSNYMITDLSGKVVVVAQINATTQTIDASHLANGQYILTIQTEKAVITKKMTVAK